MNSRRHRQARYQEAQEIQSQARAAASRITEGTEATPSGLRATQF